MHLWETDADRLLDARLPSFFSCLGCFWFSLFSSFCFLSFGFFRSLSASFGLLLLSWPERLRACLGLSWGSVWGGFRSTRTPGISLPRDWNLHFSLLNPSSKHGHLPKNILVQTVRSAANRIARKNLTPFRWQICRQ